MGKNEIYFKVEGNKKGGISTLELNGKIEEILALLVYSLLSLAKQNPVLAFPMLSFCGVLRDELDGFIKKNQKVLFAKLSKTPNQEESNEDISDDEIKH